jgi:FlaA1/EpsC-like NDP-sugar epimerase
MVPLLVDVMHAPSLERVFATYRPQLILHAAAHKHVPLTEANEPEAVLNNVIATKLLGELAGRHEAEAVVLISTDKAVNPKSILGATKRTAELVTQDLNGRYNTRFLAVRFGNVIGSAGSVIPVFREQIRQGGPVTVTHADMVRFFMTIPEASQLVMDAMTMGQGGEIFILDMGEPVRILSLAEDVITLSGLRPYEDIDIQITGSRPGEKLYEELELPGECIAKTRHPKIFVGRMNSPQTRLFSEKVSHLEQMALAGDGLGCRRLLSELVPDAQLAGVSSAAKPLAAVVHAAAGSSR